MNKVELLGRLTKEPDLRYTSGNNKSVCTFTLAVNRRGSSDRQADFIPIVSWNKIAEFCKQYFVKGMQVAIVGRIQTRTWDDSEGKRHYITEIIAEEVYFADGKRDGRGERTEEALEGSSDGFYPMDDDDLPIYR